jgi:hypothetical protein
VFEDNCSLSRREVLYCRTNNNDNLKLVSDLRDELKSAQHQLRNDTKDQKCLERVRNLLQRLDSADVSIDRPVLKQTGIGKPVKSVSKLLATINERDAAVATSLIEKCRSQMDVPQFYYTLLIFGNDKTDDIQVLNDVPAVNIKLRGLGSRIVTAAATTIWNMCIKLTYSFGNINA